LLITNNPIGVVQSEEGQSKQEIIMVTVWLCPFDFFKQLVWQFTNRPSRKKSRIGEFEKTMKNTSSYYVKQDLLHFLFLKSPTGSP
jgi:hypothetical protein